ncbi:uncharacterized protein BX664DRAFT_322264 [Halteromyces radiatus]|uniref:uncharacterized protein n=1 Tax=Halteromyces radiatus TaxID=101107 RepID=UPI00221F9FA9|nr:uncharacterized protein BX664DRAFT_322264 [Halteromyces radiatus]KAI8099853.1 hypothetical protein BX664DRAFT_322264 [Halteromyces radiatus]
MLATTQLSNSRSNRVIEELQDTWEILQKDMISTKVQLESLREAKIKNENDGKEYVQSNQECRTHIQELMELLETKEEALDYTKKQSQELEAQVKQLKDDALMSRKTLDELKKKETQLGQDRDAAVLAKLRVKQQQKILEQSLQDLDKRYQHEQQCLKKELISIKKQLEQTLLRNQWFADIIINHVENETETRQQWISQVNIQQQQQIRTTQLFVDRIKAELQTLLDSIELGNQNEKKDMDQEVKLCQDEVSGLVQRIQSYSLVLQ